MNAPWLVVAITFASLVSRLALAVDFNLKVPETIAPGPIEAACLTLADFEQAALQNNPTLAQASAKVAGSRGKAVQAGLYLNPTIGYQGEQIGASGTAGELQGGFLQQEIVTANKLGLSRAKYQQEAAQASLIALAQQHRVLNGVRTRFHEVLAEQQRLDYSMRMLKNAEQGLQATREMVNVGQANEPDLLQAKIEVRRQATAVRNQNSRYQAAWIHLTTAIGIPEMPLAFVGGRLDGDIQPLDHDALLYDLLQCSPEMRVARAEVSRDRIGLEREIAEPVPNLNMRAATGYNYETRNTVADFQVGVRLPLFDRNQGTITQAQAELTRAQAEVMRMELSLRRRFADTYARYEMALHSVENYRDEILPLSRQAVDLYQDSFRKMRAALPQVLVAERNYLQLQEEYLDELVDLRNAEVELRGWLLVDGLSEPASPMPQGHREATPKPR